jgi:outer membrane murein-binding lipoprotein Lpp
MTGDELWRQIDTLQFTVRELTAQVERLAKEVEQLKERKKQTHGI